ncbi:putative ATP-dependent RNA helicase TDRD12 isoform X2 [Corythoichthys intestinalis]|uniref:putative ATP-dependent RNA helicase TDRD12 isoform X2 n=1 Tax=Corythoichthys intestinalis TaxID=161448 RepID=UPI0025A4FCBF|nr:putative ATP-dependent RNA helicase TDRD12 isoform X2 [Corythoichthys intestinalis]XP_061812994.1 putative ATP-dependent RNA helicase TDRD12 [Nerophis lumbriciformis]
MSKLLNLKFVDPSCMWARLVAPGGVEEVGDQQYNELFNLMNRFYDDVTTESEVREVTPCLEVGQLCVVYWSSMKIWCRAQLESINLKSNYACCYPLDHGEPLVVVLSLIRHIEQEFLQLPFRMRRLHLARVRPLTLEVSLYEKAKLVPSSCWDSSVTSYMLDLVKSSSQTEAVLLKEDSIHSTAIELYVSIGSIKICVNDELVAKRFAIYCQDVANIKKLEQINVQHFRYGYRTAAGKPPVSLTQEETAPPPVTQQAGLEACDRRTTPSQNPVRGISTKVTGGQELPNSQSKRHSVEDPDASLAAAFNSHLTLLRLMRFLNPRGSLKEAETSVSQPEELKDYSPQHSSNTLEDVELPSDQSDVIKKSNDNWACARLLELLNPQPLKFISEDADNDLVLPSFPKTGDILVDSFLTTESCSSLDDAPITDPLRRMLQRKQFSLSQVDLVSWPSIARGNNTLVISYTGDLPQSYLVPFLSHMQLSTIFSISSSRAGPVAVVLCPSWKKVELVCDLLEDRTISHRFKPTSVLLGAADGEAKAFKIPKDCLLIVTTPFSLFRLLSCHCFMFLRLGHLVLDEADQLFTLAPDQMEKILQHFKQVISRPEMSSSPQQLVAVAKRWTSHMEALVANHMPHACVVIAVPEEAALYGNVNQVVCMTLESNKIAALLSALDFRRDTKQKTLIICNSDEEVEDVFKAVCSKSAFCLKAHKGLTHKFDFMLQQWAKSIGPGTHVILVTTSECLTSFRIADATCVVHFSFPSSPRTFGTRLLRMSSHYKKFTGTESTARVTTACKSLLLVSEKNSQHIGGLVRYLRRSQALLPAELLSFAEATNVNREEHKTNRPLCLQLKSFGVCRFNTTCPDRHRLIPQLDQSDLPDSGFIEVLPLIVRTASVFYGRLVQKDDSVFDSMAAGMASYYADSKPCPEEVLLGCMYAVEEDNGFHRVKVLTAPDTEGRLFFMVHVCFIDIGKEQEVKSQQLLRLPEEFQSLPGQGVEMILCQVKPGDAEVDWHPKVTRAVSKKIQGVKHRARAVFSLGNTVFLDMFVRETRLPDMKTVISEYNVPTFIMNTGMAERNLDHLDQLKVLCQEGTTYTECSGNRDTLAMPESFQMSKTVEGEEELDVSEQKPISLFQEADDETNIKISHPSKAEIDPDKTTARQTPLCNNNENGIPAGDEQSIQLLNECHGDGHITKSLHPQVCWHQTSTSLTVTLRLKNPLSQRCSFYADRAVYSGSVNGRHYGVNLDLHARVLPERCSCELKSNEPVLTLLKCEPGYWPKLLRSKNIFVSYDMDHLEEEEHAVSSHGEVFIGDRGEKHQFVDEDSDSSC